MPPLVSIIDGGAPAADGGADAGRQSPTEDSDHGSIESSFPSDGARGVPADVVLSIRFGQAMNRESVQRGMVSPQLSLAGAQFEWSEDDRVVHVTLAEPLAEATGTDASTLAPVCYSYQLSEAVLDVSGRPLRPSDVSFCTQRRIVRVARPVLDRSLTGHWRSNGTYGDGECARLSIYACVGDSGFAANSEYRALLTFDTDPPEPLEAVTPKAELRVDAERTQGFPFEGLGDLMLERVEFDVIGPDAFAVVGIEPVRRLEPVTGSSSAWSTDLDALTLAGESGRAQFRLRFTQSTDFDGNADHLLIVAAGPELRLEYRLP